MLAAMSTAALPPTSQAAPAGRDRDDACPGTLRLHAADDGAVARVRVPGGVLDVGGAEALAEAARRLGDGALHLTSRGNVQLRGLRAEHGPELAGLLEAAGLLPSRGHERVRNVVASPLSALDDRGLRDVRPWLSALDALLCASEAARALSGRFLFALDDGRGDVAALGADVTVRATGGEGAQLALGAAGEALALSAGDVPRAMVAAAETVVEAAREQGMRAWRVGDVPLPAGELLRLVAGRLTAEGLACAPQPRESAHCAGPPPGSVGGAGGGALSVHVPLGRLTALQWRELTRTAARAGGELRLTPWRGVVVPVPEGTASPAVPDTSATLDALAATGLVTGPGSAWPRVGACVGRPGCAKAHADVRADATASLGALGPRGLPLYWSGCERRCGRPPGDRIDLVATEDGTYQVTRVSQAPPASQAPATAPAPRAPSVVLDDPRQLAAALAAFTS
ncbi:cobalamin biosynthesis protein CobG [Streptomyces sp. NPDC056160]|uniref:cobalamin biosynthesis protein CobG n=1 Tax=Streptomyces sp. NPDC056160 TaxID=3345731 RepID=UPI0035E1E64B